MDERRNRKLEPAEKQLIRVLQVDGRLSTAEISRRLRISEPTIRKHLGKLVSDGTIRIRAVAEPDRLGYEAAAFIGLDVERSRISTVAKFLAQFDFVDSVSITTGPQDIMIHASFETLRQLYEFVLVELAGVEGIRDTQSFIILRSEKAGGMMGVAGLDPTRPNP